MQLGSLRQEGKVDARPGIQKSAPEVEIKKPASKKEEVKSEAQKSPEKTKAEAKPDKSKKEVKKAEQPQEEVTYKIKRFNQNPVASFDVNQQTMIQQKLNLIY